MPALLTLTTLWTTITSPSSLWTFYIAKLSQSWSLLPCFWYNFWAVSWKSSLFPHDTPESGDIWIPRSLEKIRCLSIWRPQPILSVLPPYVIHSASLPSIQDTTLLSLLAPLSLLKAVQVHAQVYVRECVCIRVCFCGCTYMLCFWGRGKVKKEELFLVADRKTKIMNNWYHNWLLHQMLIGWHLFWLSSFTLLKSFEFTGHWRAIRKWQTIDSDHFDVVKLIYSHCSGELRKHPLQWLHLIANKDVLVTFSIWPHIILLLISQFSDHFPYTFLSPSLDSVSVSPWFPWYLLSSALFSLFSSVMFLISVSFYFSIHPFWLCPSRYFVCLIAGTTPTILFFFMIFIFIYLLSIHPSMHPSSINHLYGC